MRRVLMLVICMVAVSAAMPATALAAPTWKLNGSPATENVNVKTATKEIQLEDAKAVLGKPATVECLVSTGGTVGTEGKGKVTAVTVSSCTTLASCESTGITVKALHLPWNTQLAESGKLLRDKIASGGSGAPGWSIECLVLGITTKDECTGETSMELENAAKGVAMFFDGTPEKYSCSAGGTGAGIEVGNDLEEASSGTLSTESAAEGDGIQMRPRFATIGLGTQMFIEITNTNWFFKEEVAAGHLSNSPNTAFEITAGQECYEKLSYKAGEKCFVTIKPLGEDGEHEYFEIATAKEGVKVASYYVGS